MLSVAVLSMLLSAAVPSAGVHLEVERRSCSLMRAVAQDPIAPAPGPETPPPEVSPPPLVAPPLNQPPPTLLPPPSSKEDVHIGSVVGKEVLVGAVTLLGSDVLAFGVAAGSVALFSLALPLGPLGFALGAGILLIHGLILSPLYCALAEKAVADEPTNNGLVGALLGAYGGSLAGLPVPFLIAWIGELIAGAGAGGLALQLILVFGTAAVRYALIPVATSWAMHLGSKKQTSVAAANARPYRSLPLVSMEGREVMPISAPVVLAW